MGRNEETREREREREREPEPKSESIREYKEGVRDNYGVGVRILS